MPSPERVVIAFAKGDSDQRAATSLSEGFTREGIQVSQTAHASEVIDLMARDIGAPELVIASLNLEGKDDGIALVRKLREKHSPGVATDLARPPVILIGDAEKREAALQAGASLFVPKPAYVKDIVTLAGILGMARDGLEPGWGGELGALHLYYVVRALGAARKTGVLTLLRSHRRGELRFYEGEVTSAQVGMLHGQAAFHQLLLWPEARFDLRAEQVVRRQQIPLAPTELLQDAERFLRDFNELAQGLSPSSTYEQDLRKVAEHIDDIPREVMPVLRLFDGLRSVADVIEDSSVRMGETLHFVKKLIGLGVVQKLGSPKVQVDAQTALQVEDWLVGGTDPGKARRKSGETAAQPPAGDWGALGSTPSWEVATYAPVVPAKATTGEIKVPEVPAGGSSEVVAPVRSVEVEGPAAAGVTVMATPAPEPEPEPKKKNGRRSRPGRSARAIEMVPPQNSKADAALDDTPSQGTLDPALETTAPIPPEAKHDAVAPKRMVTARTRALSGEIDVQEPHPTLAPAEVRAAPVSAIEIKDLPAEVLPPQSMLDTQPVGAGAPPAKAKPAKAPPPPTPPVQPPAAVKPAPPPMRKSAPRAAQSKPGLDKFHDHEEAFFSEEEHFAKAAAHAPESFADLDEGQAPRVPFWKRIFGRAAKK